MAFWFFSLFIFLFYSKSCAELITALPGQPHVSFKQYSGYIVTDVQQGRALFYYFVEADSADPLSRPLTLWFNGGPGCSSIGFGAFMENGPFQPEENGLLVKNEYSWNLESNMLYIESPIRVGFSYSNTSSNYNHSWTDALTAEDNLRFMVNWLEEFPQYKDSQLFLTGESYAGHYVPQLATLLVEYNKQPNIRPIRLKAIALGNPLLDIDISLLAGEYLWSHGAISDKTLMLEKTVCNYSRYFRESFHGQISKECKDVFDRLLKDVGGDIDAGDLLLPRCLSPTSVEQFKSIGNLGKIHAAMAKRVTGGDPCLHWRVFTYLNRPEVQKALHANTTNLPYVWGFCSGYIAYNEENWEINIVPLISNLILEGIPILLFSGDQDTKVPLTQTRTIANNIAKDLKLLNFADYGPWYDKKQVGGWSESFGSNVISLTHATVRGAAHEVPFTSPSQALTLFRSFLRGSPLPRRPH